jgi:hypothetical protein
MRRREYPISIVINRRRIHKVIIDPHYEEKHADSINDTIILKLVKTLDGEIIEPDQESPPYAYFSRDKIELNGKFYKLVWLLEDDEIYIGVVNAYRR